MRYLVTGGSGFIGTNLVKRLLDEGHFVRVLDKRAPRFTGELLSWIPIDISLSDFDEFIKNFDVFIHLACQSGVEASVKDPLGTFNQNVYGTLKCLDEARKHGIKRFIFASSGGTVLGKQDVPLNETLAPNPASPYGASKLACEGYCKAYSNTYGLETVILRFSNVYGPYSENKGFNLIPGFIMNAIKDELCYINGDGSITKDYIFVEDLIDAILKVSTLEKISGEIFQIATGKQTSINEVYDILDKLSKKYLSRQFKVIKRSERVGDVKYSCNINKSRLMLDFNPRYSLEEGLEETFKWFVENWGKEK